MRIQHNLMAMNAYRSYNNNLLAYSKSMARLSSGYRINCAADDAAGLAISEKMRAQIRGLNMAAKNSLDAISMVQTVEGALQGVHNILQRMREIAVQAASDTNDDRIDRKALDLEIQQLKEEISSIAEVTTFNGIQLLKASGGITNEYVIQTGPNSGNTMTIKIQALGLNYGASPLEIADVNVSTRAGAKTAITDIDNAINTLSLQRAQLGAYQNRLEYKIANLETMAENLQAAESRIRDADMAKEMVEFVKAQILIQASLAMMAQANDIQRSILILFE